MLDRVTTEHGAALAAPGGQKPFDHDAAFNTLEGEILKAEGNLNALMVIVEAAKLLEGRERIRAIEAAEYVSAELEHWSSEAQASATAIGNAARQELKANG